MKKLNKRAIAGYTPDTAIFYLVFGIVISVLMVFFMIIIYNHLEDRAKIPQGIEEFSAIERFLSDECFALDNIHLPKAIDWNRFTKENLDLCYNVNKESKKIAFNLNLTLEIQDNKEKIKQKEIKTNNWNEQVGLKRVKSPINTYVYYNNEIINGKLIISEQNV